LEFILTQHSRDKELFEFFIKYFNCGRIYTAGKTTNFIVSSFKDINAIIIPFFQKYPLQSVKTLDYIDFCRVALLIETNAHLIREGIDKIKNIKNGMNKGREN